ncbi:unnamed protein product [Linum tenue]|uniref:X8 domain-containing protein n=1 Tax=Linum tenue TaxID=586396 RepID=A0AAV0R419_9ROSI|nr:unnamed protein product [Linum tenue]
MVASPPSICFLSFILCSSLLFIPSSGAVNVLGLPYNNGGANSAAAVRVFLSDHTAVSPPSAIAGRLARIYVSSRRELAETGTANSVKEGVTLPMPTIITVPATNPATLTPTNPTTTLPIPSVTPPITVPPANPTGGGGVSPVPITNPTTTPTPPAATIPGAGAGGQPPVTNPATSYTPPAAGGGAVVTNPVAPPAGGGGNAPAVPGQSWCVAKSGVSEAALQAALDYACGMGGADCSQIQQGSGCYNPNTLQNHASFAFNSYYQKNPTATSCDFGGAAAVVSSNPSSGTCVYPSSSSSSSTPPSSSSSSPPATTSGAPPLTPSVPMSPTSSGIPVTNPATTNSSPPAGMGTTGTTVTPPSVLNSSSPGGATPSIFGTDIPPGVNPSPMDGSNSVVSKPFLGFVVLAASFIGGVVVFDM